MSKYSIGKSFFIRNYYETGKTGANVARNYVVLNNTPRLLIETVFIVSMLGYIAFYINAGGNVTNMMATLATFGVAAIRVLPSVNRINTYITEIAYASPSLDFVYDNLQEGMKTNAKLAERKSKFSKRKKIEVGRSNRIEKNISFHYPDTEKNIFLRTPIWLFRREKSVGIMGTSGAGKSTIVDILLGLLHAQEGQITCDGVDIFLKKL